MRSLLTLLLLLVFACVHGLPLKAVSDTAGAAQPQLQIAAGDLAGTLPTVRSHESAEEQALSSGCCAAELSDALAHTGSKCASDCATLLPVPPVLPLPGGVRIHEDAVRPILATAPPVAGHPPRTV